MSANFKMLAKTFFGFEDLLEQELKQMGAQDVEKGNRVVHFKGDKGFLYKANLSLRTALKILVPIHSCHVNSEQALYQAAYDFPWNTYFSTNETIAIDSVVFGETFTHSLYVSQKVKDAIADQFRAATGVRPSVDLKHPDVRINVHIDRDQCTFSLDSSGASLHHRGYRTATNIAPLNEVLAAGLIQLSGWDLRTDFLDPMCGSGTILIEAAMLSCNIPANINRKEFAFEKWSDWDEDLYLTIEEAQLNKIQGLVGSITGFDKAPSAVEKAKDNIRNANLEEFISIDKDNFFYTKKGDDSPLHIVTNPPYGERLEGDMNELYKNFGDTLKQEYTNTQAWMITSNLEAMKHVGLRPSRKIKLFNGKLESKLLHYNIYPGTKKIHKLNRTEE
ncbi:THUMP domain-containing protein [Flavobacteriaceae bacterium]|jgi:putative N6-adenine-specific DNA methylase|nr:THUMP domain-containing protein [Flavobacteriaceae bacterium]MDA8923470.1 THUMP domain-containing protein [Flavobacteriaceae bacterium]MDA9244765.1 THUMP domain-containing protein [Flavobacteriaceae bacterium]MDA9984392.1 THUMP domain-containing protein [Flavobacteriaceae bacterium]MDB2672417.1 THUMP domain-containing protein [Flavobacteriaceae bacterium]